jgi:hypothetical protein
VRGSNPAESLRKALSTFCLLEGEVEAALASGRVAPVNGDLSKPMFGLAPEAWTALAAETDIVLHWYGQTKKMTLGWVVNGGRRHAELQGDLIPRGYWVK